MSRRPSVSASLSEAVPSVTTAIADVLDGRSPPTALCLGLYGSSMDMDWGAPGLPSRPGCESQLDYSSKVSIQVSGTFGAPQSLTGTGDSREATCLGVMVRARLLSTLNHPSGEQESQSIRFLNCEVFISCTRVKDLSPAVVTFDLILFEVHTTASRRRQTSSSCRFREASVEASHFARSVSSKSSESRVTTGWCTIGCILV